MRSTVEKPSSRLMQLEGLRGIAAVMVVLYHFIALFLPAMRKGDMALAHTRYEDDVYGTPLMILFHGGLGVAIFFVLSGFVLSIGFFRTGNRNVVIRLATGRYLRLMIPALASILLAWIIIQFGAHVLTSAAGEIANSRELAHKWSHNPGLLEAIKAGVYDIFVEYRSKSNAINNPIWTMHIEFVGSFIVFGFLLIFAHSKYRWMTYVAMLLGFYQTWYFAFIIGMIIADMWNLGWLERLKRWYFTLPMAALALMFANFPKRHQRDPFYRFFSLDVINVNEREFYLMVSATLILLVVMLSRTVSRALGAPFMAALGRYTFSLYLTHVFVLYTVSSAVVIWLHDILGYPRAVLVAFLVSAPVFWLVAFLFERYVDAPAITFSKYISSLFNDEGADASKLNPKNWFRRRART